MAGSTPATRSTSTMKVMGMHAVQDDNPWKPGLPPGRYYKGMENDYEVYYSPIGKKWHRRNNYKQTNKSVRSRK